MILSTMQTWTPLQYSPQEVNAAGKILYRGATSSAEQELGEVVGAISVIRNWRDAHNYPLHVIKKRLQTRARKVDQSSVVAQRIKRFRAIEMKMAKHKDMRLAQMQDIGGCRAILNDVAMVQKLVSSYKAGRIEHELVGEKDYVAAPRNTGYRSHHLIYRFKADSEERKVYDDLKVEIQIRSKLQHAWATAVETVGFFTRHSLKSSQGPEDWLRFFALMGSAIAVIEGCPLVPDTPRQVSEIRKEIAPFLHSLDVEGRLQAFSAALTEEVGQQKRASYYLLELDLDKGQIKITGYTSNQLELAQNRASTLESDLPNSRDVVLVAANSLKELRKAFPNYHADTRLFVRTMKEFL